MILAATPLTPHQVLPGSAGPKGVVGEVLCSCSYNDIERLGSS